MSNPTSQRPARGLPRTLRRSIPVIALLGLLLAGAPAEAQSENSRAYVTIESVKVRADDDARFIDVQATVSLPPGCKLEFVLTRQSAAVQTNLVTVPENRKVRESFKIETPSPSAVPYTYLTRIAPLEDQPRAVRRAIEGDPKAYPPSIVPFQKYHFDKSFPSGTEAEIAAEVARVRKWFKSEYTALAKLDQAVSKARKEVEEGTDYVDRQGGLDAKKWRKMMDDEVLEPLRQAQKLYNEGLAGNRADLIAYRPALADLRTLSSAVALRATSRSIELYEEKGLSPAEEDKAPEAIVTKVPGFNKRVPKGSDLQKIVNRINDKLGIGEKKDGGQ